MSQNGFVYLVKLSTINTNTNVKIGMTRKHHYDRAKVHKGIIIECIQCGNAKDVENKLIELFTNKYIRTKNIEYFTGNLESIIKDFKECVSTYKIEFKNIYLDNQIIINKFKSILNQYHSISFNDAFKMIEPIILEMTNDNILESIRYWRSLDIFSNEFIVPYTKLYEYNIMTSKNNCKSNYIKNKLYAFNLKEDQDFNIIIKISNRGGLPQKIYYLTVNAYKTCLLASHIQLYKTFSFLEKQLDMLYYNK